MDPNRFTEKVQEGIRSAQGIALRNSQQQVDAEHLLLALLDQPGDDSSPRQYCAR